MIRAHLLCSFGGGLGGPLRSLPQESVARAKPALEAEQSTLGRANPHPLLASRRASVPLSSAGFAGATNPGGRFRKGGEAPLRAERTGSTPRVRPSGAALQLGPSHRSSQGVSPTDGQGPLPLPSGGDGSPAGDRLPGDDVVAREDEVEEAGVIEISVGEPAHADGRRQGGQRRAVQED